MERSNKPRMIESVQISLDIIDVIQESNGARVSDISRELDLSKGTVHGHLATLKENEYLAKDDGEYKLGFRFRHLGETAMQRFTAFDVIENEVDDLAQKSGELAQFATKEHGKAVYLYKARGKNAVQSASSVGLREQMHCISLGKAMLAHLPRAEVETIVNRHGLQPRTEQTITSKEELFDELSDIRERGYAIDNEEKIGGLKCVAAPITTNENSVLGAVSTTGPTSRMVGERFNEELPEMVIQAANVIEINSQFS